MYLSSYFAMRTFQEFFPLNFELQETKSHSRSNHKENTTVREASEKDESTTECGQPSKIVNKYSFWPFIGYSSCLLLAIRQYQECRNVVRHVSVFVLVC